MTFGLQVAPGCLVHLPSCNPRRRSYLHGVVVRHRLWMFLPPRRRWSTRSGCGAGIAAVGLYGVVSYSVARRVGIHKALGTDGPGVLRLLVVGASLWGTSWDVALRAR